MVDDEYYRVDDDDSDIESDGDVCERCDHERGAHEDGEGPCNLCARCKRFKE